MLGYRVGQATASGAPNGVLRPVRHAALRRLDLETGGMPVHVPEVIAACDLPALEHLDLWLGVRFYGGDVAVSDLEGLLDGRCLPTLRHVGLNSEIQDDIAAAIAAAAAGRTAATHRSPSRCPRTPTSQEHVRPCTPFSITGPEGQHPRPPVPGVA